MVLLVAIAEKTYGLQLLFHGRFFCIAYILKGKTVGSAIQSQEFHDPFATHQIAAIFYQNLNELVGQMLQFPAFFHVTCHKSCLHIHVKPETMVVGASNASPVTVDQSVQEHLVHAPEHFVFASGHVTALFKFKHVHVGVFHTGQIGDMFTGGFQEVNNGKVNAIEPRDVVIIERK